MLPEGGLSLTPVEGAFIYDLGIGVSPTLDYHTGGINLQDTTHGLNYQMWRGRLLNPESEDSKIVLDGRFSEEVEILQYPRMYEFNFCFDFTMRPMVVFLAKETELVGSQEQLFRNCYIYWYDNTLGRFDLIFLGSVIRTPKFIIDDPREVESAYYSKSDACLFYWRSGGLYVRYLRDRFTIEHLLKRNVPYIERVGMNEYTRLQWKLFRETDVCEDTGIKNDCSNRN